ncbi:MAG: hypothetical protein JKY65_26055 [Planctomycetes bacterium]|nr:hypothetical protein [Planctomycetota bacterium]
MTALERWINPLLQKDLLVYSRGAKQGGGLSGLIAYGVLFGLPLLGFAWALAFSTGGHRFAGRHVYLGLCAILAFVHLGVAVPASVAFALERDRNTLEGLIVSPLGAWRLVVGKLATAVTIGVLAKLALFPLLAAAFALGGGDLGFLPRYFLVLVSVDVSLASFALYLGHRQREAPVRMGWLKNHATQSQLALQTTVGISVLGFLLPFYAIGFLIPLSLKHGARVAEVLDVIAPLGAVHPLGTLAVWGDCDLFGVAVPVWLVAVVFHLVIALPLLAATAEAQRPEGAPPGRLPRLSVLPALFLIVVLTASVVSRAPQIVRTIVSLLLAASVVIRAAIATGFREEGGRPTSASHLLRGFLPWNAVASRPACAPGFALLLGVVFVLPLVLWAGQGSRAALGTALALTLAAVSLATLGARLHARVREREEEAFLAALRGEDLPREDETEDPEDAERRRKSWPTRILVSIVLMGFLVPTVSGALVYVIDSGGLPAFAPLRPALGAAFGVGLAFNPFGGLLPFVADAQVFGSDVVVLALVGIGVAPWAVFAGHLSIYGALLAGSLVTLRPPLDLERALAESQSVTPAGSE